MDDYSEMEFKVKELIMASILGIKFALKMQSSNEAYGIYNKHSEMTVKYYIINSILSIKTAIDFQEWIELNKYKL